MSGAIRPPRRAVLAGAGAIAALAAGKARADDGPVATTTAGKIRGYSNGPAKVFKGVPYGASTAGAGRFMPPAPPAPWSGIRDATRLGDQASQVPARIMPEEQVSLDTSPRSEDCLHLNLWTAGLGDGGKRPVMVWFHGGGFTGGSGGNPRYDGTNLASKHDVVLVTVNHRLNAFGFLYLPKLGGDRFAASGNVGVLDLVAALKWVRDNIAEFGGDPGNVTIFGQSGGGAKVTTLMAMPAAKGLFHRAIPESGVVLKAIAPEAADATARRFMAALGLRPNQVDALQALPEARLIEAMAAAPPGQGFAFGPVRDGGALPADPFDPVASPLSAVVPMMLGSTLTETTFLPDTPLGPIDAASLHERVKQTVHLDDAGVEALIALYRRDYPAADETFLYQLISTDNWMTANVATVAERKAAQGTAPVFVYHFEKTTPVHDGRLRSPHTLEIPYVFDNLDVPTVALVTGDGKDRYPLADRMSRAWTAFARTGDPNIAGLPRWPAYSADHRAVMIFDDVCRLEVDPHAEERAAIQAIHARPPSKA